MPKAFDLNLFTLAPLFSDENKAREFLEARRWPDGPVCPHCDCTRVYTLKPKPGSEHPVRPGVYKCGQCRKKFTVRIGTVFEESLIPLNKWLMAFHLLATSKKGMSSHQIRRELGITYKSAWFLTHRIREAMKREPISRMLDGHVEVDETYVGGKPRKGTGLHKRGRGTEKTPVMVLVLRQGGVQCRPLGSVTSDTLKSEIAENVATGAAILTHELASYKGLNRMYAGHESVKPSAGEYAKTGNDGIRVHTNTEAVAKEVSVTTFVLGVSCWI